MRPEIGKIQELMEAADYVTDAPIATSVHLALVLGKPLLIEGHAGVGKTEVAKVMARMLGTNLIRLQCYEGLDASTALYEWNYQKQLLHIKLSEASNSRPLTEKEHEIFSEPFLLRRPLLQSISQPDHAPVLLVDEVDRCVTADTLIATPAGVKRADEIEPGDTLISFDPAAFRVGQSRVRRVIPRGPSSIIRLLVGGRLLEVTPEHQFARYSDEGFEVVEASGLRPGDRLPLRKDTGPEAEEEPEFEFDDDIVKLSTAGREILREAYQASGRTVGQLAFLSGVSKSHLRNALQPTAHRHGFRAAVLHYLTAELDLPAEAFAAANGREFRVQQTIGFYELLGYIVADGCFTSDRLCIADKDRENLDIYAEKFAEAFGTRPRIVPGPHRNFELTCHSLPLGRFLERVLGPGIARSRDRRVPGFVHRLPAAKRAGFLRGYFDGEGWVSGHQVSATSSSPYLLVGIQSLLGSLGIDGQISKVKVYPGNFGKGPYFTLSITDVRRFRDIVGFCAPAKRARLAERPSRRFSIRANAFSLGKIADSFEALDLTELLTRGVVLGEVSMVEVLDEPRPVYDFVLEGQPYFVANQVVTHNCDEEFEAFMLEVFSDWQVTIPEVGTIKATHPPHVVLTSNRTRELSDALRRRCLYLWIDYPSFDKEVRIITLKVPGINPRLAGEIARFMEALRQVRLTKVPGVAESLDWAQALVSLHADHLDPALVHETLGVVLKDADDIKRFRAEVAKSGLTPFLSVKS